MTPQIQLATLVGSALLVASTAVAQTNYPIDDFEILPFSTSQAGIGTVTDILAVPPPAVGHVISTTRRVTCTVFAGNFAASAQLVTSGLEDAVSISVPSNAQVSLVYPLSAGGLDLTAGGTVDRIEMDVRRIGGGAVEVNCALKDLSPVGHMAGESVPNSASFGVVTWELTSFSTLDLTNITEIAFHFPDPAAYDVRGIRLRGTSSTDINYELYAEATITPPLPSPPVEVGILDASMNPVFDLDFTITQADAGFTPSLQWGWTNGQALNGHALHSLLDWTDPAPFDAVQLGFSVEVTGGAGGLFPELYPPDPVHGPEGVTLVFPVRLRESPAGAIVGTAEVWLTIDAGPEQAETALEFVDVIVQENLARRAWTDGFEVSFLLFPGAAGVETIWPILQTQCWMDWNPEIVTGVGEVLPADVGARMLTAAPSVTRAGANIRTAQPFERSDTLLIHDVRGRLLASLRPAAGDRAVFWDGRDDSGGSLPAGVYFVRLEGASGGTARVVKIR